VPAKQRLDLAPSGIDDEGFCCIGRQVNSREPATPEIAMVRRCRHPMFKGGRHFDQEIIILCVRWYVTYKLSYRDLPP
jgi:hypothetical protein